MAGSELPVEDVTRTKSAADVSDKKHALSSRDTRDVLISYTGNENATTSFNSEKNFHLF